MNKQLLFVFALVMAGCGGPVTSASSGPEAGAKGVEQVAMSCGQKRGTSVNQIVMDEQAVPPDDQCEKYGVAVGFRDRMKKAAGYFDVHNGKITGFDYNL